MSGYKDKSQGFSFSFPEVTVQIVSHKDQTPVPIPKGPAEGDSLPIHQDLEALFEGGLVLLRDSGETYSDIIDFVLEELIRIQKRDQDET